MSIIETIVLLSIFLIFPIAIYLIYIAYVNNMDLKEKNLFFDFALISSVFLMTKYVHSKSLYTILFYNIPLLIAILRKKNSTIIIISIIIIFYTTEYTTIPIIITIIEYLIYYIGYLIISKIKYKESTIINYFISIKSFIISFLIVFLINPTSPFLINLFYIIVTLSIFIIFTYISLSLFNKGEEIMNLNNILKDTKKQQYLYESLSKLTHELKNPITVCKGYLEMLNNNDNNKVEKYLPIISSEIDRALNVINDFSSLGKLTSLNKEELDLELLLTEIITTLSPIFKKENALITLNVSDEIYINGDYNRLKQVFVNILKNALEAKKDHIPLEVLINVKSYKHHIKIDITDNGIGMDKDILENMNKIFYTTKTNGNGLGVVLSNEIIEMHNGTIKYLSTKDIGTTVSIKLPYK